MRLSVLALCLAGCIDRPFAGGAADLAVPVADLAVVCRAQNYLSHDSFDVAAGGVGACLQQPALPFCIRVQTASEDSLTVTGLDVGTLAYFYTSSGNSDGTHGLVGHGQPDVSPAPTDTILAAENVPADVTLEAALLGFYAADGPTAFVCPFTP